MNQPTITSLPTELLLYLCRYLESDDLLNTAKSCHRLNPVAVAIFMQRTGSSNHQTSCIVKPSHRGHTDALTALTIDFRLDNIQQLCCILTAKQEEWMDEWTGHHRRFSDSPSPGPYNRESRMGNLIWNINRVTHLITRLSSVGSISLIIGVWGSAQFLRTAKVQELIFAVLDLVETSMLKGCKSFQILYSHPVEVPVYKFELVKRSMRQKIATLSRLVMNRQSSNKSGAALQGEGYQKISKSKAIQPSKLPLQSQLTNLNMSCDFLLTAPFSNWTLGIMNASPITSLTLSLPNTMTEDEFHHYLFPRIVNSLPKLQEIKLAFHSFDFLSTFVEGLPSLPFLRKITLGLTSFGSTPTTLPTVLTSLQYLASFTGSSAQAAHLFGSPWFACPHLKFVNIIIDMHFHHNSVYKTFAQHFRTFNATFSEMCIEPCISVCTANHGSRANISLMSIVEHPEHFYTVSNLTLELPSGNTGVGTRNKIAYVLDWLEVFRRLKGLTLINRHTALDPLALEASGAAILKAISAMYPDIVALNVVDIPDKPNTSHCHWSNAGGDWERGTDGILGDRLINPSVCSHF
ncbi:hypothetical protein GALMADRAFT_152005 [Galerina marginata CBS 339.88]|uniref:F-box domain-containing protein n=1 Tax=Galerina marginata (strain CBS 339.88) TaxID=685588 RepID=A0A067TL19_GALM3|nr:hypothetical protein GALMADRAFT_152005 [Galerina marginata CBS 339.88]